jgi:hypothetical protein
MPSTAQAGTEINSTLDQHVARMLDTAFADFAQRRPEYVAALFDKHFVQTRVAPALAAPSAAPQMTPQRLATMWAAQFGEHASDQERLIKAALPAAGDFIRLFCR